MTQITIDELLEIIENPTRRMILREIVREGCYPLQLSQDLKVSQQAIMKHLRVLEEKHLVKVETEKSDAGGPPRKCYTTTQMFSITIDIGPSLFSEAVRIFEDEEEPPAPPQKRKRDGRERPVAMHDVLYELGGIEDEMRGLEERRAALLRRKEALRRVAYDLAEIMCSGEDERRVLTFMIENGKADPEQIAEGLNMREKVVWETLARLERAGLAWR